MSLDDDELRVLLSHEMGHVMSGHALYRTIAAVLAIVVLGALPMLHEVVVLPVRLASSNGAASPSFRRSRACSAPDVVVAHGDEDGRRRATGSPGR